jgi:hypothetical protein
MKNNGKNNFYRLLNLDRESKLALKWFREHIKSIMNDAEKKQILIKEDKSND